MRPSPQVPVWANVHLTHARLQALADEAGVDILHIKGPTDAALRIARHDSTDADVLVRPEHVGRFLDALDATGWSLTADFDEGSPFGHAANLTHADWAMVDVHRSFPGIGIPPEDAFALLWADRQTLDIAHRPVGVLAPCAQVLIQVLHVARSHGADKPETWANAGEQLRADARALAKRLHAEVPFAAGVGELEAHRASSDYDLWRHWSRSEDNRLTAWTVRLRSTAGLRARLGVIVKALRVNRAYLRQQLGHEPNRREVLREQGRRLGNAMLSLFALVKSLLQPERRQEGGSSAKG
ncbi:nucleotidyltransferase family protein [Microbacterium esteraromaticum]|nr:nucleotidyltransferase family protein [Microbacterium esteraromaticum]